MKIFLTVVLGTLLLSLDLLANQLGLMLYFALCGALYCSITYGPWYGIAGAIIAGTMFDSLYDRPVFLCHIGCFLILELGCFCVRRMERLMPAAPLAGGFGIAVGGWMLNIFLSWLFNGNDPIASPLILLSSQIFVLMLFMLLFTWLCDFIALQSDLPRFGRQSRR